MRPRAVLLGAAAIGAVPVLALAALALSGMLGAIPAIATMVAVAIAAVVLALLWARDLDRLARMLGQTGEEVAGQRTSSLPVLPPLERLGREVERLARTTGAGQDLLDRMRRANEAIVDRLPDPLIVLGADRAVRRANAAARESYGTVLPAALRHPGLREAIDRAFADGAVQTAELTLPVPVIREVHATVILLDTPLWDGGQALIVLSDRTRERAVERMRADFVANASHELRTPLASLIGFIETLRGPASDDAPAQRRFLAIMAEQASRMNRLIDDLLSLSRIELTEHQPPRGLVDLAALLPATAAAFEPRVREAGVMLDVSVPVSLPPVSGDADQLAQVAQNLLDNAVKYGCPRGTVRLTAGLVPAGGRWPARAGVFFAVADDGQGVAREHLPRLTERFYRVDKGRSRAVGGTGLGLAIVKHIVNRHGGQLLIESEEAVGTTVSVWLPIATIEAQRDAAPPRDPAESDSSLPARR